MLDVYRFTYRAPRHLWNEVIPVDLVPCPHPGCGAEGMEKVGADPGGAHLLMECRFGHQSKVSG